MEIKLSPNDIGKRIDNFLRAKYPNWSLALINKLLRTKKVLVNKTKVKNAYRLCYNDTVYIFAKNSISDKLNIDWPFLYATKKLPIVFEDKNILIVIKPINMSVHSNTDNESYNTVINCVLKYLYETKQYDPRAENSFCPSLVHRLDMNTSGLMIVGKNIQSLRVLNDKIKNHEIIKYYLCRVHGIINPKTNIMRAYLTKTKDNFVTVSKKPINNFSQEIITKYKTIKNENNTTLLEVNLITGRTHQIRAHFNYVGHPLVGEKKYTNGKYSRDDKFKYQQLVAYKLVFTFKKNNGILEYLKNREFIINATI